MIEQLFITLIVLLVSVYVTYPFFIKSKDNGIINIDSSDNLEFSLLQNQKDIYLEEIKDIEFDYGLGKLSEEDYKELISRYKIKAASILESIDKFEDKEFKSIELDVENKISEYKKKSS